MALPIVHNPIYPPPLPAGHRFPSGKYRRLAEVLMEEGLASPGTFHTCPVAPPEWLKLAHAGSYVDNVLSANVPDAISREIGFKITDAVIQRAQCSAAGTAMAGRLALQHGLACNTAGGSHHARREQGAGYCVFNDVAVAARVLQQERLAQNILVIDLDVHQGDGTARIFTDDNTVTTFSVHANRNYPVRKAVSDHDIGLPDGTGDAEYLNVLKQTLPGLIASTRPDLVFYNAGVDPHENDRLGRLGLTDEGLFERDHLVIATIRQAGIPLAAVPGGGYSDDVDTLARRHAILHRAASEFA